MIRRRTLLVAVMYLLPVLATCALGSWIGGASTFITTLLALGGAVMGVVLLSRQFSGSLMAHLTFGALIYLYYGKLVFLWYFPETGLLALLGTIPDYAVDRSVWSEAFLATAVSVSGIVVGIPVGVFMSSFVRVDADDREQRFLDQVRGLRDPHKVGFWLTAGLVLVIVTEIALWRFEIGTLGQAQVQLPGKLSGLIYYTHKAVVPAVGLLFLCFWGAFRSRSLMAVGIGVIVFYGVIEVASRASRSAFFFTGLWLTFFLYLSSNTGGRRALLVFSVFGTVGFLAFPIVTAYRFSLDSGLPIAEIVTNWSQGLFLYLVVALKIFFRLLGAESLLVVIGTGSGSLGWFPHGMGLADYYTLEVVGYPEDSEMTASPGLVGGLYMVGGLPAVWVGSLVMIVVQIMLYRVGDLRRFRAGRIFQVLLAARLVHALFGGLTPRLFTDMLVMFVAVVVIEVLLHSRLSPPRATAGMLSPELSAKT